jgi:hypothetical protein
MLTKLRSTKSHEIPRKVLVREFLIFLGFLALTAIMTWPWVLHLRDAVPDTGDPYAISYFLWWNFHQTFHAPLHLFEATILYPYHYTLAFGEFDYGVSLLFIPLFVLGCPRNSFQHRRLSQFSVYRLRNFSAGTHLVGFNSNCLGRRNHYHLPPFSLSSPAHQHLIFAGWIPLLFEALIRFARQRSWPRAAWLGVAFLMNGLTCTSWLILTVIP